MKYATWIINFENPKYGSGPEQSLVDNGGWARGVYAEGDIVAGARILGYFDGVATGLEKWNFTELTQQEALDFVLALDDSAFIAEDGQIQVVYENEVE